MCRGHHPITTPTQRKLSSMKEGSNNKTQGVKLTQIGPSYLSVQKNKGGQSTMFSENIILLAFCTIIKMPAFRVDKFSAGRTKCRSPM